MSGESRNLTSRAVEIRTRLDRRANRILRTRLIQFPLALLLVGGLIFAMAAGGALHHATTLHTYSSSRDGGILGLKIDAVLVVLYLIGVFGAYALRRLRAPRQAAHLAAREASD